MEVLTLAPTAYEELRARRLPLSPRQRKAAARRVLSRMVKNSTDPALWNKMTSGAQYVILCKIRDFCTEEDLAVPEWTVILLALHEAAQ